MIRTIVFDPLAESQLLKAISEYDRHRMGWGLKFERAVHRRCRLLERTPLLFQRFRKRDRIVNIPGFPFVMIYRVYRRFVFVVAIVPSRSNPLAWPLKP